MFSFIIFQNVNLFLRNILQSVFLYFKYIISVKLMVGYYFNNLIYNVYKILMIKRVKIKEVNKSNVIIYEISFVINQ